MKGIHLHFEIDPTEIPFVTLSCGLKQFSQSFADNAQQIQYIEMWKIENASITQPASQPAERTVNDIICSRCDFVSQIAIDYSIEMSSMKN